MEGHIYAALNLRESLNNSFWTVDKILPPRSALEMAEDDLDDDGDGYDNDDDVDDDDDNHDNGISEVVNNYN